MFRQLLIGTVLLAVLAGFGAAVAWNEVTFRLEVPYRGYMDTGVFVDIKPGDSTQVIAERVEDSGVVGNEWMFRLAVWWSDRDRVLQAGEYYFDRPLSPLQVVDIIASGQVHMRSITFPEGLTIGEMAQLFEVEKFGSAEAFTEAAQRTELIADLDDEAENLEGYLFPETYALPRDATATDLVQAMIVQFRVAFNDALSAEAERRDLSVRDVVTLASIIQKEAGNADENGLVSAVYNNRLRIRMPLQCDPTVIYALQLAGLYDGNLTRANLEFDSPYNTYRYGGLPPGPIAAPGRAMLEAALRPDDATYLYLVSRNDGSHAFASTLREHNRNVREYQVVYFRRRSGQ